MGRLAAGGPGAPATCGSACNTALSFQNNDISPRGAKGAKGYRGPEGPPVRWRARAGAPPRGCRGWGVGAGTWEPGSGEGLGRRGFGRQDDGDGQFRGGGLSRQGWAEEGRVGLQVRHDGCSRARGGAWMRLGTLPLAVVSLDPQGHSAPGREHPQTTRKGHIRQLSPSGGR